jgi:hypothetical protein
MDVGPNNNVEVKDKEQEVMENGNYDEVRKKPKKNILNYIIDLGLIASFTAVFITGLIKFPELLTALRVEQRTLPMYEISLVHDYSALILGILIITHFLLHLKWMKVMTIKHIRSVNYKRLATKLAIVGVVFLFILVLIQTPAIQNLFFNYEETVIISGVGEFKYVPDEVETIRPDIFKPDHFSIFDILVYLNNKSKIDLKYHFDSAMNTHVIDELNGKSGWWYETYYDGGWPENNVFRMDHYPYKDKMYIRVFRESQSHLDKIYTVFRDEVTRLNLNGGKVIIPRVIISGTSTKMTFENVEVQPHNLRNDMLNEGVITAIDVIMTLGDEDKISYELQWYNSIGSSEVKNYWVDKINKDKSKGRCGFVYEAGSYEFDGFSGNHIHLPSDIRVINSPEYEEWFWICI